MTIYIGEKTSPTLTLRKKTVFHQILWSGNFVKTQLALCFMRTPRYTAETVPFHKISTPGN